MEELGQDHVTQHNANSYERYVKSLGQERADRLADRVFGPRTADGIRELNKSKK